MSDGIQRLRELAEGRIYSLMGIDGEFLDEPFWGYVDAALERMEALQKLADVTGNYLLWAPREKGHGAAHNRLWDAYREFERAAPLVETVQP